MGTSQEPPAVESPARSRAASRARLTLGCVDRPGIIASVSGFFAGRNANITQSDQFSTDPDGGQFHLRMEIVLSDADADRAALRAAFDAEIAARYGMTWNLAFADERKRVALLVSRYDHCLADLLWRWRRGELDCDIVTVISNHDDLRDEVERFGLPYQWIPVDPDNGGKPASEATMLTVLRGGVDLVVLARYMQILSGEFLDDLSVPVINIHHSFLPAFAGAGPYERAFERGVKLVGATAHYVTEELDAGPIIEQGVERVTHREDAARLTQTGADIERQVLARAVRWHLEDRVLVHGGRTVVFS